MADLFSAFKRILNGKNDFFSFTARLNEIANFFEKLH